MNTKEGGIKTARTMREKYGADYWQKIGRKGGQVKVKKGFACAIPEQRKAWGAKGGRLSRRTGISKVRMGDYEAVYEDLRSQPNKLPNKG